MARECDRAALVRALADLAGRTISAPEIEAILDHTTVLTPTGSRSYSIELNSIAGGTQAVSRLLHVVSRRGQGR